MSASHLALGGVRVQRPMAATGQAAGTAAAIASRRHLRPRDLYPDFIEELQQNLLKDGCYLVGVPNRDPRDLALTASTVHSGINDGWNREIRGKSRAVPWGSDPIELTLAEPSVIRCAHLSLQDRHQHAAFAVEVFNQGEWTRAAGVAGDRAQRRYVLNFEPRPAEKVRFRLLGSSAPVAIAEARLYTDHGRTTELPGLDRKPVSLQPPAPLPVLPGILADDAEAVLTGAWKEGIHRPVCGTGYRHDDNTGKGLKTATFSLQVPVNGRYEIKLLYPPLDNRAGNVPVKLLIDGQEHRFVVNQKTSDGAGRLLGAFPVHERIDVIVETAGTDGYVIIDGVQVLDVK
jgi:hypothetical protein